MIFAECLEEVEEWDCQKCPDFQRCWDGIKAGLAEIKGDGLPAMGD
jgi:hypothetical protein